MPAATKGRPSLRRGFSTRNTLAAGRVSWWGDRQTIKAAHENQHFGSASSFWQRTGLPNLIRGAGLSWTQTIQRQQRGWMAPRPNSPLH